MRPTIFATLAAASLCFTAVAVAQPATLPAEPQKGDAKTDQARELYLKGMTLYEQAQFDKAEAAFLAAWALKKHYQIASNLGACEMKLGRYRDAAEHLGFFLREQPPTGNADDRKRTQALFDQARTKVGAVVVTVNVPGAVVTVDGKEIGPAPLPTEVYVDPGPRTLAATHGNYKDVQKTIEATAGGTQTVALTLGALAETPQPPKGASARLPVIITGAAVAGVGVVLGSVFAGLSSAKGSDAAAKGAALVKMGPSAACGTTPSSACQAIQGSLQDQATFGNAAFWSFVGAGAVGAGTVIYALVAPRSGKASGLVVMPVVTAQGGGVLLRGAW